MDVQIKWENTNGIKLYNDRLIGLAKMYEQNPNFKKFDFTVSLEPNSRHIINLAISTKNDNEVLDLESNSYNFDNSFELLEKQLKQTIKKYDPNALINQLERKKKAEEEALLIQQKNLETEKRKLEEKERKLKAQLVNDEREKQKQQQKQNEEILKKLEKNRKEEEKEDEEIIQSLEKQKQEYEEAKRIEKENQEKLEKYVATLKFDVVADDLEQDNEIQEKIKEDKQKLKSLQAEENECLVIIEEIKELEKKEFDLDDYKANEPFMLADNYFYFDPQYNMYIATHDGQWAPISFDDAFQYFLLSKQRKFDELEARLIEARKRRKYNLKDLVDGSDLLAELEASRHRRKNLEKQQKENFKKLKENYEAISQQTANEVKAHIKPIEIEIAESHPANEPFLTENNVYAYHDGEGHYFIADEYGNWNQATKDMVYKKSNILDVNNKQEYKPGDQFKNAKGELCYFDGDKYYKLVNNDWEPCSMAEATDFDSKNKQDTKTKIFNIFKKEKSNDRSNVTNIFEQQEQLNQENVMNQNEISSSYAQENNVNQSATYEQQITDNTSQGQQWTDENGVTWYLDANGNYFWWDGTNWVPYSY